MTRNALNHETRSIAWMSNAAHSPDLFDAELAAAERATRHAAKP
jgi:hypothetical protein